MKTHLPTLVALLGLMTSSVTWAQTSSIAYFQPANSGIDGMAFYQPSSVTPNVGPDEESHEAAIQVVTDFLDYLTNGRTDKAQLLLSDDFEAFGPGFRDSRNGKAVLDQADREQRLLGFQTITIQRSKTRITSDGSTWVYLAGERTAIDKQDRDNPVRMPFHLLTLVVEGKLTTTYTSYGNDQIFYDFGFPLYQTTETPGPTAISNRR